MGHGKVTCFSVYCGPQMDFGGGKARLWSDFDLHEDGFGRLIVADRGLLRSEPSNLLQRLLEQGHYRNMALLGLPAGGVAPVRVTVDGPASLALAGSLPGGDASLPKVVAAPAGRVDSLVRCLDT